MPFRFGGNLTPLAASLAVCPVRARQGLVGSPHISQVLEFRLSCVCILRELGLFPETGRNHRPYNSGNRSSQVIESPPP